MIKYFNYNRTFIAFRQRKDTINMGLLNRNYEKPGKGVDINAPEKRGFFRFWEMFCEKFWANVRAGLLTALVSIPVLFAVFCFSPIDPIVSIFQDKELATSADYLLRLILTSIYFLLWGGGPASTAYAYVAKCHTLRKPVWVFSDGFGVIKSNFKQSILLALIDIVAFHAFLTAFFVYGDMYAQSGSLLYFVLRSVVCIIFVVYTWSQFYIYQVMTTLSLKFKHVWKNAIVFSLSSLPMNLIFTILSVALAILCYVCFNPMFAFFMTLAVVPLLTRLPMEFYAARKLGKVITDFEEKKVKEEKQL